jgi:hypothetical protein
MSAPALARSIEMKLAPIGPDGSSPADGAYHPSVGLRMACHHRYGNPKFRMRFHGPAVWVTLWALQ